MAHEGKGMTPEQKARVSIGALLQQAGTSATWCAPTSTPPVAAHVNS
jgi:hypothetical protein